MLPMSYLDSLQCQGTQLSSSNLCYCNSGPARLDPFVCSTFSGSRYFTPKINDDCLPWLLYTVNPACMGGKKKGAEALLYQPPPTTTTNWRIPLCFVAMESLESLQPSLPPTSKWGRLYLSTLHSSKHIIQLTS